MAKKSLGFAAGIVFVGFCLFTLLVAQNLFTGFDHSWLATIQNWTPRSWDTFLSFISLLGTFEIISLILLGFLFVTHKLSIRILILYLFLHGFEFLGKELIPHQSLPESVSRYHLPINVFTSLIKTTSSYPSGHTIRIVFIAILVIAIMLAGSYQRWQKWSVIGVTLLLTLIMLLNRVSLGAHWPTDVIGGILLGISAALFVIARRWI